MRDRFVYFLLGFLLAIVLAGFFKTSETGLAKEPLRFNGRWQIFFDPDSTSGDYLLDTRDGIVYRLTIAIDDPTGLTWTIMRGGGFEQ